jgi:hypothetical protein
MPRMLLSPEDAVYTARFFLKLHDMDTRNFWSLRFLDLAVTASITSIFCVTDVEVCQ